MTDGKFKSSCTLTRYPLAIVRYPFALTPIVRKFDRSDLYTNHT